MTTTSPVCCDLHTHTHFSDGSFAPEALYALAAAKGLGAIALTDHNTVDGLPSFLQAARTYTATHASAPIPVPGVELSTEYTTIKGRTVELHILALFLAEEDFAAVRSFTEDYTRDKAIAIRRMLDALRADGYQLDDSEWLSLSANGNLNRAHVAAALQRHGYVSDIKDTIFRMLAAGGRYYTPPRRPSAVDALDFIDSLGAVSVLAHPYLSMTPDEVEAFLPEALTHGLCAMETRYDTYDEATTALAIATAARFGLRESGGSDFHGDLKPGVALGSGRHGLQVPMAIYEGLAEASQAMRRRQSS